MSELFDLIETIGKAAEVAEKAIGVAEEYTYNMNEDMSEDPNDIPIDVMEWIEKAILQSVKIGQKTHREIEGYIYIGKQDPSDHVLETKVLNQQELDYANDIRTEVITFGKLINKHHQRLKGLLANRK